MRSACSASCSERIAHAADEPTRSRRPSVDPRLGDAGTRLASTTRHEGIPDQWCSGDLHRGVRTADRDRGDLSGYSEDVRLRAGVLSRISRQRDRGCLGRDEGRADRSRHRATAAHEAADRARHRGADPVPLLQLLPHAHREGERRHRRPAQGGDRDRRGRAPLEHRLQRAAARTGAVTQGGHQDAPVREQDPAGRRRPPHPSPILSRRFRT